MFNADEFQGKSVLVTGGGRGIGKSIALGFASHGASVAVLSRTVDQLNEVVDSIRAGGGQAVAIQGDVSRDETAAGALNEVKRSFGGLDVLVNCAGVFDMGPSVSTGPEEWDAIIDTNLRGTFRFCQAAAPMMIKRGRGKIINFGSLLSYIAFPERAAYAASKGGVVQLTRVLSVEWARHGINVNAVAPGMIRIETPHPLNDRDEGFEERLLSRIPAGRRGQVSDLVGPTMFLASSLSDYIVGHTIAIDGGWLAYGYF